MHRRVCVGVHRESDAVPSGPQHVLVLEVETIGVGVDLEGGAGARGRLEDRVQVQFDRRPRADAPAGQVPDDIHARVLDRPDHAAGLFLPRKRKVRVDRSDRDVEPGQELVLPIDVAVGIDVQL